jgi:hypothetical protein
MLELLDAWSCSMLGAARCLELHQLLELLDAWNVRLDAALRAKARAAQVSNRRMAPACDQQREGEPGATGDDRGLRTAFGRRVPGWIIASISRVGPEEHLKRCL